MGIVIRGYDLKEKVFSNSLFNVYAASHSVLTDQTLRITLLNPEILEKSEVRAEFNSSAFRLSFAEHPYIIKNNDIVEENGFYAILSENIALGLFSQAISTAQFEDKRIMFEKILEALIYLNDRKIFHASLTPDSIYVDMDGNPRIANYGLAEMFLKVREPELRELVLKNFKYSAPELSSVLSPVGEKAEVFSCGMLLKYIFADSAPDEITSGLKYIVRKSTDSDTLKRYRNVKELLTDFRNYENLAVKEEIPVQGPKRIDKTAEPGSAKRPVFEMSGEKEKQNKQAAGQAHATYKEFNVKAEAHYNKPSEKNTPQEPNNKGQQADYNKTREAIRQNAAMNSNSPDVIIKTGDVLVFGVLSIFFGFILSMGGFILAIIGFSRAAKNKKKVVSMRRNFVQSESNTQSIGIVLCIIGIIISGIRMLIFLASMVN